MVIFVKIHLSFFCGIWIVFWASFTFWYENVSTSHSDGVCVLQAALLGYDEGLHEDRVLASALWRRLFSRAGRDAPRLEAVVAYVRRELARLDRLGRDRLLLHGQNSWGPLHGS